MDYLMKGLLFAHLGALVVGGATNIAMPLLMRHVGSAPHLAGPVAARLGSNGRLSILVLIVTGIAMLVLRYGGDAMALGPWFYAKLVFVAALASAALAASLLPRERLDPRLLGLAIRISLIGAVAASVMVFS